MSGVFGADEAGKGPVLGSMFAAAVRVTESKMLPDGVDDSKNLTLARREELASLLREDDRVSVGVAAVPTERIDDPGTDMNTLTVEAQARAVEAVAADGDRGMLDAGDTSEKRFARRVEDRLSTSVDLAAEHGADETHAVVAAASIIAKVERDAHVAELASEYDHPVGSGYPSDPTTREFLESYVAEHGDLPPCARTSWSTCADVLAAAEQSGLGDF